MPAPEPISVIYDGDCRFCTRALRAIQRLDPRGIVQLYDSHASELVADRFPMLAGADFDQAMFTVTAQGTVFRGYFAFKEILRRLPLTRSWQMASRPANALGVPPLVLPTSSI